jgi:hypothetical protein
MKIVYWIKFANVPKPNKWLFASSLDMFSQLEKAMLDYGWIEWMIKE